MSQLKILVADDDRNIQFAFRKTFEKDGFEVITAANGREALDTLEREEPALVFMDIAMPQMTGLEALEEMKLKGIDIPAIVITGYGTMHTAVKAVQLGAYEYITKPLDVDKLRVVVYRALEMVRLREEVKDLQARLRKPSSEYEIIGNHSSIQEVFKIIGAVTSTPSATNVLITGESGSGKELVARNIHEMGPSASKPFVAINCTVLPENLLESELFGYERGAFTGASERKFGKFEMAGEGTLFLDEIGDMSPNLQQKLMRVLQQREFERLGGHSLIPVKARFVAATNKDLEEEIKRGRFRQDLYFRLNVISIRVPPLRERRDDIPLLAEYFLAKYGEDLKKNIKKISGEVLDRLTQYDYPGNVRELENVIEHGVTLEKGNVLTASSLPTYLGRVKESVVFTVSVAGSHLREARRATVDAFEKKFVTERLTETGGNVSAAARRAGIHRQSLQRLMKKHGIRSGDFRS
ncbi:MAG: sigma-54-dependent transcriptional regulator [Fidelibacterota bacterium]